MIPYAYDIIYLYGKNIRRGSAMTVKKHDTHHVEGSGHKPGPHAVPHKSRKSSGVPGWMLTATVGVAAVIGAVFIFISEGQQESLPPFERLVEQMNGAVDGAVAPTHAFGGALKVEKTGDDVTVIAEAVPRKICVNASWVLANSGVVMVNGLTPAKISAAGLAGLCAQEGDVATISWTPAKK
ncbi:MAG: hypothetical protein A3H92_05165 [Rhodospirillales bacterium RIFCSPLOWO2_02_FULL_58_16]|nr:MAG: hypothetical protein A3H92_05165 [Rhodospirillales bacterium RIFCSPLOWO2_02_FULL_58_16]